MLHLSPEKHWTLLIITVFFVPPARLRTSHTCSGRMNGAKKIDICMQVESMMVRHAEILPSAEKLNSQMNPKSNACIHTARTEWTNFSLSLAIAIDGRLHLYFHICWSEIDRFHRFSIEFAGNQVSLFTSLVASIRCILLITLEKLCSKTHRVRERESLSIGIWHGNSKLVNES